MARQKKIPTIKYQPLEELDQSKLDAVFNLLFQKVLENQNIKVRQTN